ncbi:hypothetical protein [Erwinia psidii]|uniref:hypothetical protein n=1 Tax=Erwinia psidii TaxID=69224 RepID=UPI000F544794|nr:hypothetical protein [Erwinia psidii]MCX8957985.1 hypothetical protein [Erwinia psidii]MCX8962617.1 hypothetical protein [Erwinia psidii]MCX8963940.1 hypothetical protein [Erwinia psidii]
MSKALPTLKFTVHKPEGGARRPFFPALNVPALAQRKIPHKRVLLSGKTGIQQGAVVNGGKTVSVA